jgi:hypothetical protein
MGIAAVWRPITSTTLEELPEEPGVFELANLVRSVLFIGGSAAGGLRAELSSALNDPRLRSAARYLRFELTAEPASRAEEILSSYRAAHRGEAPPAQGVGEKAAVGTLPRPAEPVTRKIGSLTREAWTRNVTPIESTFLRRRSVA